MIWWVIILIILMVYVVGSGFGTSSPRTRLIGFRLKEDVLEDLSPRSACCELEVITYYSGTDWYMYFYNQLLDISVFFKKYTPKRQSVFEIVNLEGEDEKLVKRQYEVADRNYMVFRIGTETPFTEFPKSQGNIMLFNCGSFVLVDYAHKGEEIRRSNLQKGSLVKIEDGNNLYFSIPSGGLKDDVFYGVMVY
jgi:hypothetical protein